MICRDKKGRFKSAKEFLKDWIKLTVKLGYYDMIYGCHRLAKKDQDYLKTMGSSHRQFRIKYGIYETF